MFGRRKKNWIRATAQVVGVTRPPHAATHGRLVADVVVQAPGTAPYATEYKELIVSVSKWPAPGETLPVIVNPRDQSDLEVLWNEVQTGDDASRARAEQLAASLRSQSVAPPNESSIPMTVEGAVVNVVASQSDADPVERLAKLAQLHAAGVVDDAQFAALREQILGQAGLG